MPRWFKALLHGPSDSEVVATLVRGVLLGAGVVVFRFGNRIIDEGWAYAQIKVLDDAVIAFFIGGLVATAVSAIGFYVRILTAKGNSDD